MPVIGFIFYVFTECSTSTSSIHEQLLQGARNSQCVLFYKKEEQEVICAKGGYAMMYTLHCVKGK